MNTIVKSTFVALFFATLASCGGSSKGGNNTLDAKKAELAKLKTQSQRDNEKMQALEDEIAKMDTSAASTANMKLVATTPLALKSFSHYIKLQGTVDANNISYITPRNGGGQVKAIYVKQGDHVHKGQLLLKLDDAVLTQQVATAKQQAGAIKAQLSLAKTVYQKTKNLYDQGIGTEVNLLTNKTQVTTLENQLEQVNEQVKLADAQLNTTNVYSDVNGVANIVDIRVGEVFTGVTAAGPQIEIVNNSDLKVVSTMPENYLNAIHKGSKVLISFPDLNKTITSSVSFVGAAIDANTRGFSVEAKLPADASFKPNQVAILQFEDYSVANAIAIPLNTLQTDGSGKFVYVAVMENGKLIARKRVVTIGRLNDDTVEIKSGLKTGDVLITEGYSGLYDGQQITTS
ncbi:efflux RND transporter periplasmic adaptor subunit [Arachidicoccus soli]|uniref:Efflux RND transporter periplasmic adaptor subunit n=1 Tax=Arachidicoccus soli TaxID=2341117 RepID=A0A386HSR7_9BACT|nr:efflux RND transporter periplasmic adaptor subunit [Arachidicoccus soli]AYD48450.1 efflux RND transporter periplasmic adaptor subunit [Arachidicoccus soli]